MMRLMDVQISAQLKFQIQLCQLETVRLMEQAVAHP